MQAIVVRAIGPLHVGRSGAEPPLLTQPRRLALLAYLVLATPRGLHARDSLLALLWPDASIEQGRQALRNALHALRQALDAEVVVTEGHDLIGIDASRVACDVFTLEDALADGRVSSTLDGYDELLRGFHVTDAHAFDEWLDTTRASFRRRWLLAGRQHAEREMQAGRSQSAAALFRRLHQIDPDDDSIVRRALECSAAIGDLSGALRLYRAHTVRMASEFGASPAADTSALMTRLSAQFGAREDETARQSIAILPIVDATQAHDAGDMCAGLRDGVIRRLTRMHGVRVIARGAVATHHERPRDAVAIGQSLSATIVVDSTMTTPTGTPDLEVHVEVIRVRDGTLLRETHLRASRDRLFMLEGAVTSAIVPLVADITAESPADVSRPPTPDGVAYELYVRGTYLFLRAAHPGGRVEDLQQSRDLFENALARDPQFGMAYAGLSNYYAVAAARNILRPFREHFAHVISLSHRAIELDPTLAVPHVHFGVQAMYLECDWSRGRTEFERAIALDPLYGEAHRFLGINMLATGDEEAGLRELREAVRVEPYIPIYHNSLGDTLLAKGDYEQAIASLRTAVALDPQYKASHERLIRCFERTGRFEEAVAARDVAHGELAVPFREAFFTEGAAGYQRQREAELRTLIAGTRARIAGTTEEHAGDLFNPPELTLALAHAELGEWDEARACEHRAVAMHPGYRQWFVGRPELAPLRGKG